MVTISYSIEGINEIMNFTLSIIPGTMEVLRSVSRY